MQDLPLDIINKILVSLDLDSLVSYRATSNENKLLITNLTPTLCAVEKYPITNSFFEWALMYSNIHPTRYSNLFSRSEERNTPEEERLHSALLSQNLELASSLLKDVCLDADCIDKILKIVTPIPKLNQWFIENRAIFVAKQNTAILLIFALNNNNIPLTESLLKDNNKFLSYLFSNMYEANGITLETIYFLETKEHITDVPNSWILSKRQYWSKLLGICLYHSQLEKCDYIYSLTNSIALSVLSCCRSVQALKWLLEKIGKVNPAIIEEWCKIKEVNLEILELICSNQDIDLRRSIPYIIESLLSVGNYQCIRDVVQKYNYLFGNDECSYSMGCVLLLRHYIPDFLTPNGMLLHFINDLDRVKHILGCYEGQFQWDELIRKCLSIPLIDTKIISLLLQENYKATGGFKEGIPDYWKV